MKNEHEQACDAFERLSRSRQRALAGGAGAEMERNPGCADSSRYWQVLSARQVTQLAAKYRKEA